jgi:uncharacterized protein
MLLEFTVGNYRSFGEPCTLSMMATHLKGLSPEVDQGNVAVLPDGRKVLKVAALWGPNAGGKSNLIRALWDMKMFVYESARWQATDRIPVEVFRLSTVTADKPTSMEVVFTVDGVQYRYGFEVTRERVEREWLFHRPTAREALLFERDGQQVRHSGAFPEGKAVLDLLLAISPGAPLRPNALFLSMAAQTNGPLSSRVAAWFNSGWVLPAEVGMEALRRVRGWTATLIQADVASKFPLVRTILEHADLGIRGFEARRGDRLEMPLEGLSAEEAEAVARFGIDRVWNVNTTHTLRDADGKASGQVTFDLDKNESRGTQKLFALAGMVAVSLANGNLFVADELDAHFHPHLTRAIIGLFQDPASNPKDAQLIFATHDDGLLEPQIFRRDQVWFVEKGEDEASTLRSLAEFRGLRADRSYREPYLEGRLGAVPILRRFGKV